METPRTAISLVHQPLPFPLSQRLLNNDHTLTTLFSELTSALRNDFRLQITSIRIFHTLIDNLPQENQPTSPPVTPSNLQKSFTQNARGYFTLKPVYPSISGPRGLAVPPGEALVSITERIIPSCGEFEISSFLSSSSDSAFQTRLEELHPGGMYIFVLPTLSGGHTFHREYLSKLLDPILRSMTIRHNLSSRLAFEISNAKTLDQLRPFEHMKSKLELLITARNAHSAPTTPRAHMGDPIQKPKYTILHSQKGTHTLPFLAWYSWWLGQERARILGILNFYVTHDLQTRAGGRPYPPSTIPGGLSKTSLMLELDNRMKLQGLHRGYVETGIELACFVVKRTV